MKYVVRVIAGVIGVAVALVILIVGYLWIAALRAVPPVTGTVTVAGLAAPVTIARDMQNIPFIKAQSEEDAYFALGYVHAQERLFQMELMRRQGQGRLAELIGSIGVGPDTQMRTLGVYRKTEADFAGLDAAARTALERYAAGVNAWLKEGRPLPLEFALLHIAPELWKPADSLVWQKLMGLQLSGNWSTELFNAALVEKLGATRASALSPGPKADDPVTMSTHVALFRDFAAEKLLAAMTAVIHPTTASNVWVVGGAHTQSGQPILANDPHLGFQSPNVWFLAGIDSPTLKVFGGTIPGVPFHMIGHTDGLAWGLTTTESDTADLFIEQTNGETYDSPDGAKAFETRTEVINVRFGSPVSVVVRETRHGPVVSDIVKGAAAATNHVLALSAALFQPGDKSGEAVYRINHAQSMDAFLDAIKLFYAPHQNMMFADRAGNIGYYAPGRVPIRKNGNGLVPVPGWTGEYDWTGFIPFEELPHSINPPSGILVNANNKMVDEAYPYLIAAQWPDSYRAKRIDELLKSTAAADVGSITAVQQDVVSLMARELLPILLDNMRPRSDGEREVLDKLRAWDGTMDRNRPEPLIALLWIEAVKGALLADELGPLYAQFGGLRPELLQRILTTDTMWCDDVRTSEKTEICPEQIERAWQETLVWMNNHGISKPMDARWGDYHQATFGHMLFGNIPRLEWLGMQRIPTSGDNFTINRGSYRSPTSAVPFSHVHGASVRMIYDLSDLNHAHFTMPDGESGHIASPHYGDMLGPWRDGVYSTEQNDGVNKRVLQPAS